jgi:hypothetical protein
MTSKNLDRRFAITDTSTTRYLKHADSGLVISKLSIEFLCYTIARNRVIGVDEDNKFFVFDTTTNNLNYFGDPINDLEDLGNGFIQLSYQVDCTIIDAIDLLYLEFSCIDVLPSKDPSIFVIETDTTLTLVDRHTRRIKLKTTKV